MRLVSVVLLASVVALGGGCGRESERRTVVVYASWDQLYSEPVFREFESRTGIGVRAAYDTEASKVTGLVNRLIAEKQNPQADVLWSAEVAQTIMLKRKGILAPYTSPAAHDVPLRFKDPEGYWTGFAARSRVLVYNTDLVAEGDVPSSIFELTDPKWKARVAIANPLFGTTGTHVAALFEALGKDRATAYLKGLKDNEAYIADSNSRACEMVARGEVEVAFTDTDDVNAQLVAGKPVAAIYPDQGEGQIGTLVIPNSVALIAGAPHEDEAKALIDFLLRPETEATLADSQAVQMPVRDHVSRPTHVPRLSSIKTMQLDFGSLADRISDVRSFVREELLR